MTVAAMTDPPVVLVQGWLMHEWDGALKPSAVLPLLGEDSEGRDAWFFHLTFPVPDGETWDADAFATLHRAFRDKALDVGLPFPWYIVPHAPSDPDAVAEDDEPPAAS